MSLAFKRSDEIDFLRGIAVILVLCNHHWFFSPINQMGWIGVDLFFVLSGFLVSGLLFLEFKKFGNIKPKLFLIRRGFKIYPLFYFSIILTAVQLLFFPNMYLFPEFHTITLNNNGVIVGFIIEATFLQSIFMGLWPHHWSLSVEEFFYFFLVLFLYSIIKKNKLSNQFFFLITSVAIFSICLFLRIISNNVNPSSMVNFTGVHLRIDSLFAGVLLSYFYHFNFEKLSAFYTKYRRGIALLIVPLICYAPFYNVFESFFIKTIGFTLIYTAFTFLLLIFLLEEDISQKVKKIVGSWLFKGVAKVGFYSYSIYLFHYYIIKYVAGDAHQLYAKGYYTYSQVILSFGLYFIGSILIGIMMSFLIEIPMLKIRDKYFPRRSI